MKITGFSHYNLRAPRELLDVLCAFYTGVVGLRLGRSEERRVGKECSS